MRARLIPLLALLALFGATQCVKSKKSTPDESKKHEQFVVSQEPSGMKKLGVTFDGKITLLGYETKISRAVKPGEKVSYKLYWRAEQPLGKSGWELFTHILNEKNNRLLNIDGVGPLREYKKQDDKPILTPSTWKAGTIYVDEQSFTVPKKAMGGALKIVTGIWKGQDRLKVTQGPSAGENRALVATFRVTGNKPADEKLPELRVDKLAKGQKITIDGKLDEAAWGTAANTGAFVNVSTGKPDPQSAVQGSAKLTWDDEALYIGFEVKDENVVGGFEKSAKDPQLWTKDTIEIMIDPDGDGDNKDYYEIQVNPQNLVFDSRFDEYNKPKGGPNGPFGHQEWASKITSAVIVDGTLDKSDDKDKGYSVEIRLPWKSLDKAKQVPPALGDTWRMNFYAMQNNGGVAWSPILGQGNFHKASRFGRVLWAEQGWAPPKPEPAPSVSLPAAPTAAAPSAAAGASQPASASQPTGRSPVPNTRPSVDAPVPGSSR